MMEKMRNKKKKGFTLIELIVVIVILGILAAVAIPRLTGFQENAKISSDKATFSTLNSAIAIGVTNGDIKDGTVQVVTAANTGKISVTLPSGGTSGYTLLESGAELKLNSNINKTFQWTVSGGKITAAPTINESTGQISATTTTP